MLPRLGGHLGFLKSSRSCNGKKLEVSEVKLLYRSD